MFENIVARLREIERKYQVIVLYAVESGSRAWGLASKTSDYDVRFIYVHPVDWYLTIDPQGMGKKWDVIELPIEDHLDISGWEITKALRLFRKSNPAILEWMRSGEVYLQQTGFISGLRLLEKEVFNPQSMLFHYIKITKNNWSSLHGKDVKIKNYLNAFRSLLAGKWIVQFHEIPPLNFQPLIEHAHLPKQLKKELEHLEEVKICGEQDAVHPIPCLNDYIEKELNFLIEAAGTWHGEKKDPTAQLDELFRMTLKEAWGEF